MLKLQFVDLRSDTVTKPTAEMRKVMYDAPVGDDVMREDPSVNALEEYTAQLLGKEAALLVPSGTFGNQLALFTHCVRGQELICSDESHIVQWEGAASTIIAGVQLRTVQPVNSYMVWDEIEKVVRKSYNIHCPDTGLIALENATGDGNVQPLQSMKQVYTEAHNYKIPVHLDGARIFNAALALNCEAAEIAGLTDSVMCCLSKGLGAPVGSMLVGSQSFIDEARRKRKLMGGGMRQAGMLAAAGMLSLTKMRLRLHEDHQKARLFAEELTKYPEVFQVYTHKVKINMVFAKVILQVNKAADSVVQAFAQKGIHLYSLSGNELRFVFHYDITDEQFAYLLHAVPEVVESVKKQTES